MSKKKLILVRGLPGSGKSTFARAIAPPSCHWEADMFFCRTFDEHGNDDGFDGPYKFVPELLTSAHAWCLGMVETFMDEHASTVVVSNTFSQLWEMQPYYELADRLGWDITVIHIVGNWGSIHNVPDEVVAKMRDRWERCEGEMTISPAYIYTLTRA